MFGDASYGTAAIVKMLEAAGVEPSVKVQPPTAREGMFSQEDFEIDTKAGTACCPGGKRVVLKVLKDGSSVAAFGDNCATCPLKTKCTEAKSGRTLKLHPSTKRSIDIASVSATKASKRTTGRCVRGSNESSRTW